jgi:hypothetical protein
MPEDTKALWAGLAPKQRSEAEALVAGSEPLDPGRITGLGARAQTDILTTADQLIDQARARAGDGFRDRLEAALAAARQAPRAARDDRDRSLLARLLVGPLSPVARLVPGACETPPDPLADVRARLGDLRTQVRFRLLDLDRMMADCARHQTGLRTQMAVVAHLRDRAHQAADTSHSNGAPARAGQFRDAAHDLDRRLTDLRTSDRMLANLAAALGAHAAADRAISEQLGQLLARIEDLVPDTRGPGTMSGTDTDPRVLAALHADMAQGLARALQEARAAETTRADTRGRVTF